MSLARSRTERSAETSDDRNELPCWDLIDFPNHTPYRSREEGSTGTRCQSSTNFNQPTLVNCALALLEQVSHELAPFVKKRAPALGDLATSAGLNKGILARTMKLVENTFSFTQGQDAETVSHPG